MVLLSGSRQLDLSVLWVRVLLVFGSMQLFRSRGSMAQDPVSCRDLRLVGLGRGRIGK